MSAFRSTEPPTVPRLSSEELARRFRALFDHTYQLSGLLSPEGILLEVNRTALEFGGLSREDVVGLPLWETPWYDGMPESAARVRDSIAAAARGEFVRFEMDLRDRSGDVRTIDFSLMPVADESGQVVLLIPEGRDVTDRRLAEEALRISEAKFSGILTIAADAIVTVDEERRIILFNNGAQTIFGYAPEEVLGESLDLLIPEQARQVHRRHIAEFESSPIAARRMGERREIHGRRKGGELFPAEASISKIEVAGRRFFTAVLRDVTERKRAEQEREELLARETEARERAEQAERESAFFVEAGDILNASLDYRETLSCIARLIVPRLADFAVVDVVDGEDRVRRLDAVHADPALEELARRFIEFPLDRSMAYMTHDALEHGTSTFMPEVTDEILAGWMQGAEHLAMLRRLEMTSFIAVPLLAHGHIVGAFGMGRSGGKPPFTTADLRVAEEVARRAALAVDNAMQYQRAQHATQLRDEVLGIVSHDLRNPLSVISMCATSLLELPADSDGTKTPELARTIVDSADWMQRMIQDLLDVSSIEAGRLSLERGAEDPFLLIHRVVAMFEPAAEERQLSLLADLPETLPRVLADPQRVMQVLGNLVGNAVKFTEASGRITIRAAARDSLVEISVADTGSGIPPDELPRIFDRFWHARRSSLDRGTGLGLTIARGIVEAHGGQLRVESAVGAGSTFTFTLPRSER